MDISSRLSERRSVYTISITSRLCALPIHRIRWLEDNDFIEPTRTEGNQRLFSDEDIEMLREIATLLERHINLAGIRTILEIKRTHSIGSLQLESATEEPDL